MLILSKLIFLIFLFKFYSPQAQMLNNYPNNIQSGFDLNQTSDLFNNEHRQNNVHSSNSKNQMMSNFHQNQNFNITKNNDNVDPTIFNTRNEISMIISNHRKNDCLKELLEK